MNNIKILFWNSNVVTNKLNELQALVSLLNVDIIRINKTHLKTTAKLHISNFHTYKTDLPFVIGFSGHRGTTIFIHQPISLRTDLQSTSNIIQLENYKILISAVYKPSNQILDSTDLDTLTQSSEWSITAGKLNSNHPLLHSWTINPAGSTLYNYVKQNDYVVRAPITPTYYPYSQSFRPNVLDIVLIKVTLAVQITNFR
jgi:hypothetical protein